MISFPRDPTAAEREYLDRERPDHSAEPRPLGEFMSAVLAGYGISADAEKPAGRLPTIERQTSVFGAMVPVR